MRELNQEQIDILSFYRHIKSIKDLPVNTYQEICNLHLFETIYQEIDRHLHDNYLKPSKCFANYQMCYGDSVEAINTTRNSYSFICENCGTEKSYGGYANV